MARDRRHKRRHKRKHASGSDYREIELNIMPFIDVFSLLNTFLLMSAVFLSVGILEVQIPFLTSAPPERQDSDRSLEVKVDMTKEGVEVVTSWSKPPENPRNEKFPVTPDGLTRLHKYLVDARRMSPENDKVQFFTDDDVIWNDIAKVLDAIKVRQPGDPVFEVKSGSEIEKALAAEFLFPKVVMASVML